jgi:hypothetical protein
MTNNQQRFEVLAKMIERSSRSASHKLALLLSAWTMSNCGSMEGMRQRQLLTLSAKGVL